MLKFKIITAVLLALFIASSFALPQSTQAAALAKYEYLSTGQDGDSLKIGGVNWAYMQFTVGATGHTTTQAKLYLKKGGAPGTVTVSIRNATAGLPVGADLSSITFDGTADLAAGYAWITVTLPEVPMATGVQYAIIVRATAGDTTTNYVYWGLDNGGGIPNGSYGSATDSGVTWATGAPKDALFEVWGGSGIEVIGARVFTGYITTGDWLIVADTKNVYPTYYPNGDAQAYFQLQLLDGATIKASTPVRAWDKQPLSIYLSPATALTLTWGSAYKLRMVLLATPTTYEEYTLTAADWTAGGLFWLDGYIKSLAGAYQTYYGADLLVNTVEKGLVLNTAGGVMFDRGIPLLSTQRPGLFATTYTSATDTPATFTHAGEAAIIWSDRVGVPIADALTDAGTLLGGMSGRDVLKFIILSVWLICALMIGTGHYAGGAVAALPIVVIGVYFGGLGLEMVLSICGIAAIIVGRAIFINNQG
jgi:hypothetical protein